MRAERHSFLYLVYEMGKYEPVIALVTDGESLLFQKIIDQLIFDKKVEFRGVSGSF